ncbi:MAG: hypothetical protein ACTSP1_17805 [Candidatus Freyarchaeota archaeon]
MAEGRPPPHCSGDVKGTGTTGTQTPPGAGRTPGRRISHKKCI